MLVPENVVYAGEKYTRRILSDKLTSSPHPPGDVAARSRSRAAMGGRWGVTH